ncbi:PREDICTED: kinesin KIN-7O [Prunus dulcis]|uniref:PREDICTED: kinesin KIN-7O n=1 Tax=Prunus dulcis TaxID=3755 RepID=A0A5E4GL52_PRUDU|nr:PREDICTED: kinesin KIN-7O [Prunus dulcis]
MSKCKVRNEWSLEDENASMEKSFEIDQLNNDKNITVALSKQSEEMLSSNSEMCGIPQCEEVNVLRKELSFLSKERDGLLTRIKE